MEELKLLADTAPGFANVEHLGVEPGWTVTEGDMEWVEAKVNIVRKWRHLQFLTDNLDNIDESLVLSLHFMHPSAAESVAS